MMFESFCFDIVFIKNDFYIVFVRFFTQRCAFLSAYIIRIKDVNVVFMVV